MNKRVIILGILLGLITPLIGIFAGLQLSTTLGNILAFPVIIVAYLTGTPFGMWSTVHLLIAAIFSITIWIVIIAGIDKAIRKR